MFITVQLIIYFRMPTQRERTLVLLHCAIFGHGLEVGQLTNLVWHFGFINILKANKSGTKIGWPLLYPNCTCTIGRTHQLALPMSPAGM